MAVAGRRWLKLFPTNLSKTCLLLKKGDVAPHQQHRMKQKKIIKMSMASFKSLQNNFLVIIWFWERKECNLFLLMAFALAMRRVLAFRYVILLFLDLYCFFLNSEGSEKNCCIILWVSLLPLNLVPVVNLHVTHTFHWICFIWHREG